MTPHYNIVHLTSAHPRYDTRIYLKMCTSLAKNNYDTVLVVADGQNNEIKDNIQIIDVGKPNNRVNRILKTTKSVYIKALELDADLYHIHDPELIPIGLKLKKKGKKVIFDAHEDLPKQIIGKPYLKNYQKNLLSWSIELYEKWACQKFNAIITATPYIRNKFLQINPNSIDINNYPILGELSNINQSCHKNYYTDIAYVGGIAQIRGILEVINAFSYTKSNAKLNLVGEFNETSTEMTAKTILGWQKVQSFGLLNRYDVAHILGKSIAGIVTFLPLPNHIDSQPNKMFEYMSASLPVIASNFPLWQEIIEGNNCGICVNPENPKEIAEAIDYLVQNPNIAEELGKNGKNAVENKYNWQIEEQKLLKLYSDILGEVD